MAEEAPQETQPEEPSSEDAPEKQAAREYVDQRLEEYLGDQTNIVEEKAQETEPDTKPEPEADVEPDATTEPEITEEPEPEAEIDAEEFSKEISDKVTQQMVERLTGQTEVEAEEEGFTYSWTEDGRNPESYDELASEISRKVEFDLGKQQQEQVEQYQQQQQVQQEQIDQWNEFWDGQLNELRQEGVVDKGKEAEDELFTKMAEFNQERAQQGRQLVYDIPTFVELSGYADGEDKQPAGADAPVSGGKTSVQQPAEDEQISWEKIHQARSYEDLLET